MIRTRKNVSNLKKFCIYITQEKTENGISTLIDHIGDNDLYEELKKSIIREYLEQLLRP